eukprot:snap_masked-scaffold_20-processed-gene-2.11-mRNA-1 protein AED:1.00 eAED:1.00 QI:0/-1/0/0/-1/1/1/0/84
MTLLKILNSSRAMNLKRIGGIAAPWLVAGTAYYALNEYVLNRKTTNVEIAKPFSEKERRKWNERVKRRETNQRLKQERDEEQEM